MAWRNPLPQAEFLEPITPPPCLTGACASLYDTISSDTKYFNLAILASVPPSSSLVHEVIIKKGGGGACNYQQCVIDRFSRAPEALVGPSVGVGLIRSSSLDGPWSHQCDCAIGNPTAALQMASVRSHKARTGQTGQIGKHWNLTVREGGGGGKHFLIPDTAYLLWSHHPPRVRLLSLGQSPAPAAAAACSWALAV